MWKKNNELRNHSINPQHMSLRKAVSVVIAALKTEILRLTLHRDQKYNWKGVSQKMLVIENIRATLIHALFLLALGPALCSKPWILLSPGLLLGLSRWARAKLADMCVQLCFPAAAWTYRWRARNWTRPFSRFAMRTQQVLTASMGLILLKHVL